MSEETIEYCECKPMGKIENLLDVTCSICGKRTVDLKLEPIKDDDDDEPS